MRETHKLGRTGFAVDMEKAAEVKQELETVIDNSRKRAETSLLAIQNFQLGGKQVLIDHYKDILAAYGFGWKSNNGGVHIYFNHGNFRVNLWPTTHKIELAVKDEAGNAHTYQGAESVIEKLHQLFNDTMP